MTTEYQLSRGAQIKVKVGASYEALPGIEDFDGPDLGTETEEITNHSSPGMALEHAAITDKEQTLSFAMVWDPTPDTAQEALRDAAESETPADKELEIQYIPAGQDGYEGIGILETYQPGNPVKGVIKIQVALKVTGGLTPIGS